MDKINFIKGLTQLTESHLKRLVEIEQMSEAVLQWRPDKNSWNCLECIEHLNLYADFYHNKLAKALDISTYDESSVFKSSWLGKYLVDSIRPKAKLNKMKTFKDKNPLGSALDRNVLSNFRKHQEELLYMMQSSFTKDINSIKIPTMLSKWIKMNLGETISFLVNHNERHMRQINRLIYLQKDGY